MLAGVVGRAAAGGLDDLDVGFVAAAARDGDVAGDVGEMQLAVRADAERAGGAFGFYERSSLVPRPFAIAFGLLPCALSLLAAACSRARWACSCCLLPRALGLFRCARSRTARSSLFLLLLPGALGLFVLPLPLTLGLLALALGLLGLAFDRPNSIRSRSA